MGYEVRYVLRQLTRTPVTTFAAVLTLALGIGANAVIFSLLNALLLQTLPVASPGELVRVVRGDSKRPDFEGGLSLPMAEEIRQRQQVFSGMFAWSGGGIANIEANGSNYIGSTSQVSAEYFDVLGVRPRLGRFFASADGPVVAVISHQCWLRRYGGDLNVLGRTIRVEGVPLVIVGVGPENFGGLVRDADDEVIVPFGFRDPVKLRDPAFFAFQVYARLRPGMPIAQARQQLEALWSDVRRRVDSGVTAKQREQLGQQTLRVDPAGKGSSFLRQTYRQPLSVLLAMVGALLLIACVNLANLTLARAARRRGEFAIRSALGASRWRLARMVLLESLVIAAAGSMCGIAFAALIVPAILRQMWSGFVPLSLHAGVDLRVLGFITALTGLTTLLFGLAPAWQAGKLGEESRTVRSGQRAFRWMVPAQIGLSFALVMVALLLSGTLQRLSHVDAGFRKEGLLLVQMYPLRGSEAQTIAGRAVYFRELVSRVTALSGVESASYSHMGPLLRYESKSPASVSSSPGEAVQAVFELVGPGFFDVAGMRVLRGRDFLWSDEERQPAVAVISDSLARRLFPGGDAVGQQIDFGDKRKLTVVGVVSNASLWKPDSREPMAVYRALMQEPDFNAPRLVVRVSSDGSLLTGRIKQVLESLGHHTVLRAQTGDDRARELLANQRISAMLASFFGATAALLAGLGLYGTLSQAVTSRTGEIGIRIAVGAQRRDIAWLVGRQVVWMLGTGLAIGIPAAWIASRLVAGSLYAISVVDPLVVASGVGAILLSDLAAAYLPVRRALQVDPVEALR